MTVEAGRENLLSRRVGIHEIAHMSEQILLMMVQRTRPTWKVDGISAFAFDIKKDLPAGTAQIHAARSSSFGLGTLRLPYIVRTIIPSAMIEGVDTIRPWGITDEYSFSPGDSLPIPLDSPFDHELEHDDPIELRLARMKGILGKAIDEGLEGWVGTMNLEVPMVLTLEH